MKIFKGEGILEGIEVIVNDTTAILNIRAIEGKRAAFNRPAFNCAYLIKDPDRKSFQKKLVEYAEKCPSKGDFIQKAWGFMIKAEKEYFGK